MIVGGVVLLAGTGVLTWLLVDRASAPSRDAATATPAPARAATAPKEPVHARLELPQDAMVVDMRSEGNRIVLLLRGAQGAEHVATIDAATGERLALLALPEGQSVVGMASGGGRVALLMRGGDKESLATIDAATGERRLLLDLAPASP